MENYYEIDFRTVGTRILEARRALHWTQEKASRHAFITSQYWSLIETGKERASVNTYRQIAAVLGLTLNDLFYESAEALYAQKFLSTDGMLLDCTEREKTILYETLLALKAILKRNRKC